jgi:hypothetical protein
MARAEQSKQGWIPTQSGPVGVGSRLVPTWAGPGVTPRCRVDVDVCVSVREDCEGKSSSDSEIGGGGTITDRLGGLKLSDEQVSLKSDRIMQSSEKKDLVDLPDDPFRSKSESGMRATDKFKA